MSPGHRWPEEPDDESDDEEYGEDSGFGEAEPGTIHCPACKAEVYDDAVQCPTCGTHEGAPRTDEEIPRLPGRHMGRRLFVLRSLKPLSFMFFGGTLGLLGGIILGAYAGATRALPDIVSVLPDFFAESQTKLMGAIAFAASFGIFGFLALGLFFALAALIVNLILSLIGGLKFVLSGEEVKHEVIKPKQVENENLLDL